MDKNTLVGILLMGAVIFGFMYLNRPSEEQLEAQRQEQLQREADAQARRDAEAADAMRIQTLTDADLTTLRNAVKLYGKADNSGSGAVYSFRSDAIDLRVVNDSVLEGSVMTAGGAIDINNLISGKFADGTEPRHAAAASRTLRDAISDLARYKNFATHLSGTEETVTLENEVLALELSTKGGQISGVRLKQYDCYLNHDTTNVVLWNGDTNEYFFTLRSDSQKFDTSDFYFTAEAESDTTMLMKLDLGADAWWGIRYTLAQGDDYLVKMDVVQHGMVDAGIIPSGVSTMEFTWHQKMLRNEEGRVFEERNSAIYYKESGDGVDDLNAMDDDKK